MQSVNTYIETLSSKEYYTRVKDLKSAGFTKGNHFLSYKTNRNEFCLLQFRKDLSYFKEGRFICHHKSSTAIATLSLIKAALGASSRFIKTRTNKDDGSYCTMIIEDPSLVNGAKLL